jgi:hypothetical protein
MKELADLFDITVALPGTRAYCFKPLNSRAITTAVTFLSTYFTTHQITKNLKLNSTDILAPQMIISSYIACEYDGHCGRVLFKKDKTTCSV